MNANTDISSIYVKPPVRGRDKNENYDKYSNTYQTY